MIERIKVSMNMKKKIYDIGGNSYMEFSDIINQLYKFPQAKAKVANVARTIENLVWNDHEVTNAYYDCLTGEIELELNKNEYKICPSCGKGYSTYSAISRLDNKTEICPDCGTVEALNEFYKNQK